MIQFKGKIVTVGNSVGITIPRKYLEENYIQKGDEINLTMEISKEKIKERLSAQLKRAGFNKQDLKELANSMDENKVAGRGFEPPTSGL